MLERLMLRVMRRVMGPVAFDLKMMAARNRTRLHRLRSEA